MATATATRSRSIAFVAGLGSTLLVIAAVYFGSGGFSRFDVPLAAYAAATVFAAFAIGYRYTLWVQRPQTWLYFKKGWLLFLQPSRLLGNVFDLAKLLWSNIVAQRFIERRSHKRWAAHMLLAWGCMLAFAITFPLSWGWLRFNASGNDLYIVEMMGRETISFDPHGVLGFLMFNGLNISAIMVLGGVGLAMHRRVFDQGAQSIQQMSADILPLLLLFSVSITGLMLTASYRLMAGQNYAFLSLIHAFTVLLLLLYLPFGKLFHILQRPAQLGVQFYKAEGERTGQAICPRSGEAFQPQMHRDDLVKVMKEIDIDFGEHQSLSPMEKRKLIALNQAAAIDGVPYVG